MGPLAIGIISGLVTFLIVLLIKNVWERWFLPWYENKIYRDIRLDGHWETKFFREEDEEAQERATIYQKAHRVRGTIIYDYSGGVREYEFTGQVRNLLLTAEYGLKGPSSLDRGAFALAVKEDGRKLEGYLSWYSHQHDEIKFSKYVWSKRSR